jgi:hypothetical protein
MAPTLKPLPGELPREQAEALNRHLDSLRQASAELAPAPELEARLQKAWKKRAQPGVLGWMNPHRHQPGGWGQMGIPVAALGLSLAFIGWLGIAPLIGLQQPPATPQASTSSTDSPFIALQPMERIAMERDATVVTTTFPRALLANYGMPVSPERAGEQVRADMLLSGSGQPLALRIIE